MIKWMPRLFFIIGILLLFQTITINGSEQRSKAKADQIIQDICERLHDDNLDSDEKNKWYILCEEWNKRKDLKQNEVTQDDNVFDEGTMKSMIQPRKARAGGGSRSSGSGIRTGSGTRTGSRSGSRVSSSVTRYRNTRTGLSIPRPVGSHWSRTRLTFLPIATRFGHRYRSSNNRFTTPSTSTVTYYYCTSNIDSSMEIQCSSTTGDTLCCEHEETHQPFCCGGDIPDDIEEDANRAVQILARIFYTLAAMALCVHLFMRRFYY